MTLTRVPACTVKGCPNKASAYQEWDNGWKPICLECHLEDCCNPVAHRSEAKRGRTSSTRTRDGGDSGE